MNSDFVYSFNVEAVGLTMCQQCAVGATFTSARNCTPNQVLSSGTNMFQEASERMTKDTTMTAPSTIKIKVVAPPDGNIFTDGAKRFHCAEVLPTEVYRWILPNLHLHAIGAALVVPTQEQADYSGVRVGGPFKTTVTELSVSVDSVVTGNVAFLLLRWKGSCRRSSVRRWRKHIFLNRYRAHRPWNTQFLEVPRFKAVVRCLVQHIALSRCRDRCW